ncbi:MAG: M23 family metallopeptidase [Dehalococcoidia bacterium]|nr:M23 family metallopeptidase [Dehalococcoidia bacterium]
MRILPLLLLLALTAAACGGSRASSPSPTASPSPSPTRAPSPSPLITSSPTPVPTPTPPPPPPPPPTVDLSGSVPRQGGFLLVRLLYPPADLGDAGVSFAGQTYQMLPAGDRWYALIGLPTWFATGDYPLDVSSSAAPLAATTVSIGEGGFQYESIELPPASEGLLSDQSAVAEERATLDQIYGGFTPERRWSGSWLLPAAGNISNVFGLMRSINGAPYYPHSGTDIANEKGTPVWAANSGVVSFAGALFLFGNAVIIDHGAGVFSAYNHLDSIVAQAGQAVSQGDLLGAMGETGYVNGPHVHWEIVIHGVRVDPMLWTQGPQEP